MKAPRVVERKLGRYKAWGTCSSDGEIEIDPRQKPKQYMDTLVHELLHWISPKMSERQVRAAARLMTRELWKAGFRRIET
jgi:hypothetical protein